MSPEAESNSLSDPMTVQKLQRIYYEVLLKQDFTAILIVLNSTFLHYPLGARGDFPRGKWSKSNRILQMI
jgi:hypothetical protein